MEKLKKARTPIRGLITKTINDVKSELAKPEKDIINLKVKFERLNELQIKIQDVDSSIFNELLEDPKISEEEQFKEVTTCEDIITEMVATKLKIDQEVMKVERIEKERNDDRLSSAASSSNQRRQVKLPKIELKKFSGKVLDWLDWWAQFSKIQEDEELYVTDKFQYLLQSMEKGTKGEEIVKSFPATEANYPKVILALQERFGRKKLLMQVYIRELFQISLENVNKKASISSMHDKLVCQIRALDTLGITSDQATLFLYPMIESSLPEDTLKAWQRSPTYEKYGSQERPPKGELDYLLEFLQLEVEREEQRTLVRSNVTASLTMFVNNEGADQCIFCENSHFSHECSKVRNMDVESIRRVINEKVCSRCLKYGHFVKQCNAVVKCTGCARQHYEFMCRHGNNQN